MIYALLSRNFVVEIYALFPQNILDWGADSANFFAFWMYAFIVFWDIYRFRVHVLRAVTIVHIKTVKTLMFFYTFGNTSPYD